MAKNDGGLVRRNDQKPVLESQKSDPNLTQKPKSPALTKMGEGRIDLPHLVVPA